MQSQQLLANIFLLCLENDHLRLQINNPQSQNNKDDDYVLKRIELIEVSMANQLKFKEEKIGELNQHIREIHGLNENLSTQLDTLRLNYKNLQQAYVSEVTQYKEKLAQQKIQYFKSLQAMKNPHEKCCDHQYTLRVLERQKEQLSSQIERLTKVTIKQLQTDLEILMKENQSYMLSINNYRAEQNGFKNQKIKLEEDIKKYCELANQHSKGNIQWQKNISQIKIQNQKLKAKCHELEKQHQHALDKLTKTNSEATAQLNEVLTQKQRETSKLKQTLKALGSQIQKKSKKLKEYDDQYALYVTKMNNLMHQAHSLKVENTKIKQKSDQLITQERSSHKEKMDRMTSAHNIQINKIKSQFEEKLNLLIKKSSQDKFEQIKQLQHETALVKEEFENLLRDHETKYKKIQQERDSAIKQWEQLLAEMGKQKVIISSLQKQIDCYRKSNQNYLLGYSANTNEEVNKKSMQASAFSSQIPTERRLVSTNRDKAIEKTTRDNQYKLKSEYSERDETEEQDYLKRIKKLKEESAMRQKQTQYQSQPNNVCCVENYRSSLDPIKQERAQKYEHSNIPRSKSISSTRERYSTVTSKTTHMQTPYNKLHTQQNPGLRTQNERERPPLSSKRKENFKKYEYLRTKTQENIQSNYEYVPKTKQLTFFDDTQRQNEKINTINSIKQNYQSLRTQSNQDNCKNIPEKLMRSSSLQKVDYDKNLDQIQQYLSFNLNSVKKMSRSASDHKLKQLHQVEAESYKSRATLYDSIPEKNLLMEKINNIGSARDQHEMVKQTKFYNFSKRPQPQTLNRNKMEKNIEKENLNEIIHRKCQYISQS